VVWTTALAQELGEEDVRGRAGNCGGTKRERALGAGEQQGAVTAWKYKCCPFLQGEADVNQNNGTSTKSPAVTDSKGAADPKNAWPEANPADTSSRPHLIRLFSRDAPGREDNTFKDRPSESDELQTIQEDSAAASENSDLMASQKRSSFRHGSKMASASTTDHARHGSPRHRDSGLLDSLGRFFGGERHVPRRGSGKGGEGHKPGYGGSGKFYEHKSAHKGHKGSYHEGQGTLSKIFKLGGSGSRPGSRSGSPVARR
uniref:Myelin basic protein n=1 Tax=Cairina moschata TaxID=8855 RepID=A0A8C3GF18_CAIMO